MAERVKPGRLRVTARGLNRALAAGEQLANEQTFIAQNGQPTVFRPHVVKLKNNSGAARVRGDCLQILDPLVTSSSAIEKSPRNPLFTGVLPDLSAISVPRRFAILLDPCEASRTVEAVLEGAAVVRIDSGGSGPFLAPQTGSTLLKRNKGWGIAREAIASTNTGKFWAFITQPIAVPPACYHRRSSSHLTVSGIGICADLLFAGQTDDFGELLEAGADNGTLKVKAFAQHIAPLYELHWTCMFRNSGAGGDMQVNLFQYRGGFEYDFSWWRFYPQMHAESGGSPAHTHTVRIGGPASGSGDDAYLTASGFMVTDLGQDDLLRIVLPANTAEVPYTRLLIRPITGY